MKWHRLVRYLKDNGIKYERTEPTSKTARLSFELDGKRFVLDYVPLQSFSSYKKNRVSIYSSSLSLMESADFDYVAHAEEYVIKAIDYLDYLQKD